jgi:hypothetical protein
MASHITHETTSFTTKPETMPSPAFNLDASFKQLLINLMPANYLSPEVEATLFEEVSKISKFSNIVFNTIFNKNPALYGNKNWQPICLPEEIEGRGP